jgi:hypothetical protein
MTLRELLGDIRLRLRDKPRLLCAWRRENAHDSDGLPNRAFVSIRVDIALQNDGITIACLVCRPLVSVPVRLS